MGILSNLEPKEVFQYFEELCTIPHASYHEEQISDYCMAFAKEHGLEAIQDEYKNVIIKKAATEGYEQVGPIIIQGHLDMVCEKEKDCTIDFLNDPLTLEVKGDYISAKGTTLGGDDGIAVAYALAVLASDTLEHPAIEAVFTVSEEVGMEGAAGIDLSGLQGKRLLNIDSEEEGIFLTSCAGGARITGLLPVYYEEKTGVIYDVCLDNMAGGHSGVEIHKGGGNAGILMARALLALKKELSFSLIAVNGGMKDNAIPKSCKASILLAQQDEKSLKESVVRYEAILYHEFHLTDPLMKLYAVREKEGNAKVFSKEDSDKLLMLLHALPNGILTMSKHVEGLVETSLNLGILKTAKEGVSVSYAVRSSVESAKEALIEKMRAIMVFVGADFSIKGNYPGWAYKEHSPLRDGMIRIYEEMYGRKPRIEAVHAGLECGLLSDKIKDLDCISFGPNMQHIHTTEEQLCISSSKRVWEYLIKVIATV